MATPPTEFDLFVAWRQLLSLVGGVYAAVLTSQSLLRWTGYLRDDGDRLGRLARRYVLARILGVRLRRYCIDALQIVVLAIVLLGLVLAHRWIEPHAG